VLRHSQHPQSRSLTLPWTNSQRNGAPTPPEVAITASLLNLADMLERHLTEKALELYLAVLADLMQEEAVLAFSRAAMERKFFPAPLLCANTRAARRVVIPSPAKPRRRSYSESWRRCACPMGRS
jgi:hypothetical protein